MKDYRQQHQQTLFEKNLITEAQWEAIATQRRLNLFSLHNELRLLLYLSILSFTSGIGILIYQNIDSIGHAILLSLLFVVIVASLYFCFKNASGFDKKEVNFANPLFDYLVLLSVVLSCTFIGYLQYQYHPLGPDYGWATLLSTVVCLSSAYYFDTKSALSLAITGLAAYIGLTVNPMTLIENDIYNTTSLSYSGIALGCVLILWSNYAARIDLKQHFNFTYLTFAIHLITIACITNLYGDYWPLFALLLGATVYYFLKVSYKTHATSLFVFSLIYGYVGINVVIAKILSLLQWDTFSELLVVALPFYLILSVIGFIKLIKNFNRANR